MTGGRRRRRVTDFSILLSAFVCGLCGGETAWAGEYVYVEVFCNNPHEVRADAPRPDPKAPKLLSDPEKPPLVCRYFSNVVFAGRFRPREFAGDGPAPQEQVQES